MDKYDYITATIEEEKDRLEKIIEFLGENNSSAEALEYRERYNNICKYLTAKSKFLLLNEKLEKEKESLEELNITKDEYEVDNILLEDTLLSKFNEDTLGKYRNLLYEDIKYEDESIRELLYLLFEKQSNYHELINKRNNLLKIINSSKYPKTYETLISQKVIINGQEDIFNKIFLIENNIKSLNEKIESLERSVMTEPILKILYEFWIIDSYDVKRVDNSKVFNDNKSFINIKNNIVEESKVEEKNEEEIKEKKDIKEEKSLFYDLNLPGIDEEHFIDIDGKKYVKSDK